MKKIIAITIFFIGLSFVINVSAKKDYYVIIDPGHGGPDPGTVVNNVLEKDINLDISLMLNKTLKNEYRVKLIRDGDYDLSKPNAVYRKKSDFDNRISIINNSNADFYLSIHQNYLTNSKYYGPQVFYYGNNKKAALLMQEALNNEFGTNRSIKEIPKKTYMYSKLRIPGLLIECGFLSNDNERNNLVNEKYQKRIAKAILIGLTKIQNI